MMKELGLKSGFDVSQWRTKGVVQTELLIVEELDGNPLVQRDRGTHTEFEPLGKFFFCCPEQAVALADSLRMDEIDRLNAELAHLWKIRF
jgi:hypothetical protein